MTSFDAARLLLQEAVAARAFPAAAVEVGWHDGVLWREAFGRLSYEPGAAATTEETLFDLASLTKVVATTTLAMGLVDAQRLGIDDRVGSWLPEWRGPDRDRVTAGDLLAHASGLTAHLPFYRDGAGRAEFQRAICTMPLEYVPRTEAVYSDLGFILLGFIVEDAGGARLDEQFATVVARLDLGDIAFRPSRDWRARTAPTEVDPWRGRLLVAEVHDENAWALGGVAGHTGLFGTVASVGRFAQVLLRTTMGGNELVQSQTLETFLRPTEVPGSSRALGWDTMLPTSSCGRRMSAAAIGHTGFAGTSLWIDKQRDIYVVLLTNRIHPSRHNEAILQVRPALHDAIMAAQGH